MGSLLGSLLPRSLGMAFSPLGIIAIIVVLLTARPVTNGLAFNLGWFAAIAVIFAITYAVTRSFTSSMRPIRLRGSVACISFSA
jgi:hypothetical protein